MDLNCSNYLYGINFNNDIKCLEKAVKGKDEKSVTEILLSFFDSNRFWKYLERDAYHENRAILRQIRHILENYIDDEGNNIVLSVICNPAISLRDKRRYLHSISLFTPLAIEYTNPLNNNTATSCAKNDPELLEMLEYVKRSNTETREQYYDRLIDDLDFDTDNPLPTSRSSIRKISLPPDSPPPTNLSSITDSPPPTNLSSITDSSLLITSPSASIPGSPVYSPRKRDELDTILTAKTKTKPPSTAPATFYRIKQFMKKAQKASKVGTTSSKGGKRRKTLKKRKRRNTKKR
jgi:hypothetical protein